MRGSEHRQAKACTPNASNRARSAGRASSGLTASRLTFGVQASACLFLLSITAHAGPPERTYGGMSWPAKGNIQLDEGTVELYVISGFDSQEEWKHTSTYGTLFNIVMPEENWHYVVTFITWSHAIAMVGYAYPTHSYVWNGACKWKPDEAHVVAWTWSGRKRSVFVDGVSKYIGKGGAPGDARDNIVEGVLHGDMTKAQLMIGRGHS